ncbi:MAG: YibE/F family protein [Candidatus Levybacteria bacterium]|nr:YibE/F family protein [Candidatus Levybacteria bacterium]
MVKKIIPLLIIFLFLFLVQTTHAQEFKPPTERYFKAEVIKIIDQGTKDVVGHQNFYQILEVKELEGKNKGKTVRIENAGSPNVREQKSLKVGEKIVALELTDYLGKKSYSIWDRYRLSFVVFAIIGFFLLVVIVAGFKGVGSIMGMFVSLAILMLFIVPQILKGEDPLLISILGSLIIMVITIYLAHGLSKKTTVAVVSTFLSLIIVGVLGTFFVKFLNLSGLGNEENFMLQLGPSSIKAQGLLLGGIIIGALGVLDDITTTQSASLFILFELNPANSPYWVILNSETIIEEVIRTLAGSIGLILAVPITTVIAAYIAKRG